MVMQFLKVDTTSKLLMKVISCLVISWICFIIIWERGMSRGRDDIRSEIY